MGRHSTYTPEIADLICERLIAPESLRSICRDESMPGLRTVMDWLLVHEDFRSKYARARELQGHVFAEETIEIADDASRDYVNVQKGETTERVLDSEHVNRSRLRILTRQWMAEKLVPKKYGPRAALEVSGPGGGPIESVAATITDPVEAARVYQRVMRGDEPA